MIVRTETENTQRSCRQLWRQKLSTDAVSEYLNHFSLDNEEKSSTPSFFF